jgi:hypothetical protein
MTPPGRPLPSCTLPEGWTTIGIPRSTSQVAQVSAALTAAYPVLAAPQAGVTRVIAAIAAACTAAHVVGAHVTVVAAPGGAVPVTLTVSASPLGAGTVDDMARDLAPGDGQPGPRVQVTGLPAGRAVRAEWLRAADASSPGSLVVQYLLPMAGGQAVCVLTFAAPAAALAGRLRPVFQQIAGSVRLDASGQTAAAAPDEGRR